MNTRELQSRPTCAPDFLHDKVLPFSQPQSAAVKGGRNNPPIQRLGSSGKGRGVKALGRRGQKEGIKSWTLGGRRSES